jgi:hypothetical protein
MKAYLKSLIAREPAALVGLAISVLLAVQNAVATSPDWKTALPLIVSLIIRQLVTPNAAVTDAKYQAFVSGLTHNPNVEVQEPLSGD